MNREPPIHLFSLLGVIILLFFSATPLHAQDDIELPQDVFIADEDHDPSELIPILDEPRKELQGSVEDSFYGIIHYDIYERAYFIEDFFPLGYSATVEYEYYSRLYETELGWEPRVSKEIGTFMRGEKTIASYTKEFDEEGNRTSMIREGFSIMIPIMQAIAAILGLEANPDDI